MLVQAIFLDALDKLWYIVRALSYNYVVADPISVYLKMYS